VFYLLYFYKTKVVVLTNLRNSYCDTSLRSYISIVRLQEKNSFSLHIVSNLIYSFGKKVKNLKDYKSTVNFPKK